MAVAGDEVYVGRQPVLDARGRTVGYELLCRRRGLPSGPLREAGPPAPGPDLVLFGLERLVPGRLAFVPVPLEGLADGFHLAFPADRLVLEVPEAGPTDRFTVELLQDARARGYRVALADYCPGIRDSLLGVADLVMADVRVTPPHRLQGVVPELRRRGVRVVATHVESHDEAAAACRAGADFVGGFYFQRPAVLGQRHVAIGELPAVRLVALVGYQDVSVPELESVIACDPALTRHVLRLAGSAAAGTARPVTSLRAALLLLGRQTVKKLALVAMVHGAAGKMGELTTTALVRAKMCEHLAAALASGAAYPAFLAGLLSLLDAVFDAPLAFVIEQLAVPDEVVAAVLAHEGLLGGYLATAIAYERGAPGAAPTIGVPSGVALDAYIRAVEWADGTVTTLNTWGDAHVPASRLLGTAAAGR